MHQLIATRVITIPIYVPTIMCCVFQNLSFGDLIIGITFLRRLRYCALIMIVHSSGLHGKMR